MQMLGEGELVAGKYRVIRMLGQGGMGAVALASHEALSLEVAIKFLTLDASDSSRSRFAREGRAAARLQGRHTAKVFDVGALADGTPYMVMEYLRGADLDAVLAARGPLPVAEVVEYMMQACEGLAEAHLAGIVHRDIKPANLFLSHETDGRPLIKILDFGISKATFGTQDLSLTSTQAVLGSPLYMSPEQLRGAHGVDARTDIWSLGVVMYQLLTGRVPFNGSAITELTLRIAQDAPRAVQELRSDVPPNLAKVVYRCLAKDPAERFPSAYDLAVALEPFSHTQSPTQRSSRVMRAPPNAQVQPLASTHSASVSAVSQSALRAPSRRLLVVPGLLVVGALAGGGIWLSRHSSRAGGKTVEVLPSDRTELPPLQTTPSFSSPPAPPPTDVPTSPSALPTGRVVTAPKPTAAPSTVKSSRPVSKPSAPDLPSDRK